MNAPARITVLLLIAGLAVLYSPASAEQLWTNWTNPSGGDWSDPGNWDSGVPDSLYAANIIQAGTYTVTITGIAYCASVVIGAADSGTQTLEVLDTLITPYNDGFYAGGTFGGFQIDSNGVLDIHGRLVMIEDSTVAAQSVVRGGGTLKLRGGSSVDGIWNELVNTGTVQIYGDASIASGYTEGQVLNQGDLAVIGGTGAYVGRVDNFTYNDGVDSFFAAFTVDGALTAGQIINEGWGGWASLDVLPGAVISMSNTTNPFWGGYGRLVNLAGGRLRIWAGSEIKREYPLPNLPNLSAMLGGGEVEFVPDTTQTQQLVRVESYLTAGGHTLLDSTNLQIYDWGRIADSVQIAAICTLFVAETSFDSIDALIRGDGTLIFTDDSCAIRQQFPFAGRVMLDWTDSADTFVEFNPPGNSTVNFNWLGLLDSNTVFQTSNTDTIRVDTVTQLGGIISGATIVNDICDWRAGTVTADTAAEFLILPGADLTMSTASPKTLDSLPLHIEGTATLQDEGVLTLLDSAVVNVAPGGAMDVRSGFEMDGVGTLYNSGWTHFDPQGDTIKILVPVINSTAARTPGTIDVLSAPVVWNSSGWNGADLNLNSAGQLLLNASLRNAAGGTITSEGGHLVVNDTLWNEDAGLVNLFDGALIDGGGVVMNGGTIVSGGGVLMSVTNNMMSVSLLNLPDSGKVNVIADTLTVTGTVTNQDTITIHAGAVLRVLGVLLNDISGVIRGNGTLDVSDAISFVNNGTIAPGLSPGSLTIDGDLYLGPTSTLLMELRGPAAVDLDRLNVTGSIQLGGRLALSLQDGYIPQPDDSIQILACANWSGQFASVTGTDIGNGQFLNLEFGPGGMRLSVMPGLSVVLQVVDSQAVRLFWQPVAGALSYTVYSDSALTGSFSTTYSVPAPDTTIVIPAPPGAGQQYFFVTVSLP